MTLCQHRASGGRLAITTFLLALLAWPLFPPCSAAQNFADDPELRRLRDGASRLRELQGWGGGVSDSAPKPASEPPTHIVSPTPEPMPTQPPAPEIPPRASLPVAIQPEPSPPPSAPLPAAEEWQTLLLWRQDTLADRLDVEIGDLTRRLRSLEEHTGQLSSLLSWLSGGMALLLAVIGAMAIRLRRRSFATLKVCENPPPPSPYRPLPFLPQDDYLAASELLLLSGHYRQCLQKSREGAASATAEELPLLIFFEAAAQRLLGEEDSASVERLREILRERRFCGWPLHELDSWLLLADMPEEDRVHLGVMIEWLRSSQSAGSRAKKSPSASGEAFIR